MPDDGAVCGAPGVVNAAARGTGVGHTSTYLTGMKECLDDEER